MNLSTAQAPYAVRQRYTPKWQINTFNSMLYLNGEDNALVPITPMTDIVPITAKYCPNCCKTLFPADNICSMMGLLLSNLYVVPHWGHLRAFGAREEFPCEVCIHLSRHCSCATSVHVHGCVHSRGGCSGAKSQKVSLQLPIRCNKIKETNDCQNALPLCIYSKVWPVFCL